METEAKVDETDETTVAAAAVDSEPVATVDVPVEEEQQPEAIEEPVETNEIEVVEAGTEAPELDTVEPELAQLVDNEEAEKEEEEEEAPVAEVTSEKEEEPTPIKPEEPIVETAAPPTRRMSKRTRSRNTNSTSSNMSEAAPSTLQVEQLPETIVEEEKDEELTKPKPRRGRPKKTPVKEPSPAFVDVSTFDPQDCLDRLDRMEREYY